MLSEQTGCCALCQEPVLDDAVLDHCHKTGLIRGVLHRGCNSLLGKIENNMPRSQVNLDRLEKIAENLIKYIVTPKSEFLHPTHRTPEEKKLRAKKRAKARRR